VDLTEDQLKIIKDWARSNPDITRVQLFGSRAKGSSKPKSDIDVAVTIREGGGPTLWGVWALNYEIWQDALRDAMGISVEVWLYGHHPSVTKACEEHGVLIYDN
jgi:predicted nucleotidyltransferase